MGFFLLAFMIFSLAGLAAGYYAFSIPQQNTANLLDTRLRDLRLRASPRRAGRTDLVRREERGAFAFLGDMFSWGGVLRRLQEKINQADLKYRAADVAGVTLVLFAVFFLLFKIFIGQLLLCAVFAACLASFPLVYIFRKRRARLAKFETMLPDAIDLFNRSMRAGHNIHSGLETMASETSEPVRGEFKKLMEELALGSPLEAALHNLGKRVPIIDLKFFITGLILQRQTGANMVSVLENLALLVRERLNLHEKMKAGTAQQRLSAGLLCALPIFVGAAFWILKPEQMRILTEDETGSMFFTYAIISEIVGILVIRKMANLKI